MEEQALNTTPNAPDVGALWMFGAVPEWIVNDQLKLKAEREGFNSLTTE